MKIAIFLGFALALASAAPVAQELPASYTLGLQLHALNEKRVLDAAAQLAATGAAVVQIPGGGVGHSGLVGASGVIGPSGACGPSGCIQFSR